MDAEENGEAHDELVSEHDEEVVGAKRHDKVQNMEDQQIYMQDTETSVLKSLPMNT